jgi:hypothetical protein
LDIGKEGNEIAPTSAPQGSVFIARNISPKAAHPQLVLF